MSMVALDAFACTPELRLLGRRARQSERSDATTAPRGFVSAADVVYLRLGAFGTAAFGSAPAAPTLVPPPPALSAAAGLIRRRVGCMGGPNTGRLVRPRNRPDSRSCQASSRSDRAA
jgi:hypothetical protein